VTTTLAPITAPSAATAFGRLLLAEWTKLRTVRSTLWSLVLLVVLTLGFTILITSVVSAQWAKTDPASRAQVIADPTSTILGAGFQLSQLTVCVLGVLVIASEYSTGMIRSSVLAAPKRLPILASKALVFAAAVFVVGELVAFPAFFIGAAILHSHAPVSLSDPGVFRAVVGAGLYLTVLGVFALAIGAIVRHTAGAITGVIGLVLVIEPLTQILPGSIGKHVHAYMPSEAGKLVGQAHRATNDLLGPWQGFAVFCGWTAVLLAVAAVLMLRRDA
jgi:ABC-type transport system involved in multi-copper enzyme maturation permease subunit